MNSASVHLQWIRRVLLPHAARYKWTLVTGAFISIAVAGLSYLNLQLIRALFDDRLYLNSFRHFLAMVGTILGVVLLSNLMNWFQASLNSGMIVHINRDLIDDFYARICSKDFLFFHAHSPGRLLTLLLNDVTQVTPLITMLCIDAVKTVLILLILFLYLITIQWQVLALYACLGLSSLLITDFFTDRIKKLLPAIQKTREAVNNKLIEYFQVIHLLKIFDVAGREKRKVTELNAALADQNKKIILIENAKAFSLDTVTLSIVGAFVLVGYNLISRGVITPGKFVTILIASYLVNGYVRSLFDLYAKVQQVRVFIDRLRETFGDRETGTEGPGNIAAGDMPLSDPIRSIVFDNVHFTYHRNVVLQDASCAFEADAISGITGESGLGKTTLLNLILRLISPSQGEIIINGVPMQKIDPQSYVRQISYLPQNALLLNGTIADNIAFGDEQADREKVVRSANMAGIHDFIASAPAGYDTIISTGMSSFSEGEKKRIEIARALYKDSSVIILDEPTANLDLKNKVALLEVLKTIRNKVIIIVSHDMSVLDNCSKILLINGRKGVELLPSSDAVYRYYADAKNIVQE